MGKEPKKQQSGTEKKASAKRKKARDEIVLNIGGEIKKTGVVAESVGSVKEYLGGHVKEFNDGMDPDKLANFKKELKIIIKGGAYFSVAALFLIAALLSIELHSDNRVYAGTKAGDINLSYMEYDRARAALQEGLHKYFNTPVKFTLDGAVSEATLEELGIRVSVDQTMAQLPVIKFEETGPVDLMASLLTGKTVSPSYTINGDQLEKTIETKFDLGGKRAKNARIVYADDNFRVEPEQSGQVINREKLLGDIRNKIDKMDSSPVSIEIVAEEPRLTADMLAAQKDRLVALLDTPLTLTYENNSATVSLLDHLDAVNFEEKTFAYLNGMSAPLPIRLDDSYAGGGQTDSPVKVKSEITVSINAERLEDVLKEALYNDIEIPTSPANIYTNEEGKVVIEGKGEDGRSVPRQKLMAAMELAVGNGLTQVPVPVNIEHAPLTISDDLQELGVKDLIATGHSAYYGSPPNRMFNINLGVEKYNGLLIEPGSEFSFNDILGEVDAASGFKPEKVIKKDKIELEYGGGICQVSTTFYRAALLAGLPITERKPHSWKVSYYSQSMGDGLDATIYPGVSDLKFINDTPAYLLIQSYTEGAEAYFKIYGTNDGRLIALDGPYGGGLTYRWNRTVTKDGKADTEEIWSKYKPIPPPDPVEKPAPEPKPIARTDTSADANFNF